MTTWPTDEQVNATLAAFRRHDPAVTDAGAMRAALIAGAGQHIADLKECWRKAEEREARLVDRARVAESKLERLRANLDREQAWHTSLGLDLDAVRKERDHLRDEVASLLGEGRP